MMLNQLLQRVWNRSAPANPLTQLSAQPDTTIEPVTDGHVLALIHRMLGSRLPEIGPVFSVRQPGTEAAFNTYIRQRPNRRTLPLWHPCPDGLSTLKHSPQPGSTNRPPLGAGVRFAERVGDASATVRPLWPGGQERLTHLAIYEVHVGNQLALTLPENSQVSPLFLNSLDDEYDSVAVRTENDPQTSEFIVSNPAQYTIRYLVQLHA